MNNKMKGFVDLLSRLAIREGMIYSSTGTFGLLKGSTSHTTKPEMYPPMIMAVGQGDKYCLVGNQKYDFSAGSLITFLLPIPVQTEIVAASVEKPFLAAGLAIDLGRLGSILHKIDLADSGAIQPASSDPSSIFSAPLSDKILDAFIRLLETMNNPRDATVLSEPIIDEIYYHILVDERGGDLRYLLQQRGEIQRISKAVEHIHKNLDQPVSIEKLAQLVHMSRTTFYENFKHVMHVSPLQYAKSIKLHRAQTLIHEGKRANEAAYMVGYNSPAQFSREYKRHFGYVPSAT